MDRNLLLAQSPTAQVRTFTENLLRDGLIHSRKGIVQYIEQQRELYNLPEFRAGHIAGGIQQATINCEKLGRGSFRMRTNVQNAVDEAGSFSRSQATVQIIEEAIDRLSALAREIDFINANAGEMQELELLRDSVNRMKEIREIWVTADNN